MSGGVCILPLLHRNEEALTWIPEEVRMNHIVSHLLSH